MAILDDCKIALRTTTTDAQLVARINLLIDSAKQDIILGDVHEGWVPSEPTDPIVKSAITCYVCWLYFNDINTGESDKWLKSYDIHRNKLHNRSKYQEAP